jgi:hypothetical protein
VKNLFWNKKSTEATCCTETSMRKAFSVFLDFCYSWQSDTLQHRQPKSHHQHAIVVNDDKSYSISPIHAINATVTKCINETKKSLQFLTFFSANTTESAEKSYRK